LQSTIGFTPYFHTDRKNNGLITLSAIYKLQVRCFKASSDVKTGVFNGMNSEDRIL
jgi:hypothetical protein